MFSTFWQNKRVFVTGHTGFKGSWLCLWLKELGAIVQGYSLSIPTEPSLYVEAQLDKAISSRLADIRDTESLRLSMQQFQPEIVFHLAAQALVRLSYESPLETYSTNVMGTASLFEAIRTVPSVRAVINVTSDKCYENNEWYWGYRETDGMGGFDPYSSSKGCAELVTSAYRRSFFHPEHYEKHQCAIASARAGNVIGGGDWAVDRLIPDILRACAREEKIVIRNPAAVRPWQHVLEPLSGYLKLAEHLYQYGCAFDGGWNFGPKENNAQPVKTLVEYIAKNWDNHVAYEIDGSSQPHEAGFLKLDCSKARQQLNWQAIWDLEQTLERTINWHQAWLQQMNMYEYSRKEIIDYMNSVTDFNL